MTDTALEAPFDVSVSNLVAFTELGWLGADGAAGLDGQLRGSVRLLCPQRSMITGRIELWRPTPWTRLVQLLDARWMRVAVQRGTFGAYQGTPGPVDRGVAGHLEC